MPDLEPFFDSIEADERMIALLDGHEPGTAELRARLASTRVDLLAARHGRRLPQRIRMTRQRPWRRDNPDAIIVDRTTKWGNPILASDVGGQFPSANDYQVARLVVRDFEPLAKNGSLYLPNWRFQGGRRGPVSWTYPSLDEIRAELAGHDLACWCPLDQACHIEVLLVLANGVE